MHTTTTVQRVPAQRWLNSTLCLKKKCATLLRRSFRQILTDFQNSFTAGKCVKIWRSYRHNRVARFLRRCIFDNAAFTNDNNGWQWWQWQLSMMMMIRCSLSSFSSSTPPSHFHFTLKTHLFNTLLVTQPPACLRLTKHWDFSFLRSWLIDWVRFNAPPNTL